MSRGGCQVVMFCNAWLYSGLVDDGWFSEYLWSLVTAIGRMNENQVRAEWKA